MYKLKTSWGHTSIDPTKIYKFDCSIDVWRKKFSIELFLSEGDGTISASYDNLDDLIRAAKELYLVIDTTKI